MSVKELHKNLKNIPDIVADGTEISILKNSKPAFKIVPISRRTSNNLDKKYTLKDFEKLQFNSGEKDLSQNIDNVIYDT